MIPYIILFLALFLCGFLEVSQVMKTNTSDAVCRSYPKKVYVILPVIIILFLGIFRETTVGYDSENYYLYYWSQLDRYSWTELLTAFSTDNGFYLVLKVISLFTEDWWAARAILFVLTFLLYYVAIQKETPYPSVSLLIFVGLASLGLMFSILRQSLAGAICLFAYRQIRKGSWSKCLLLIIVAATIHKTALMCAFMLLIYFLRRRKFSGFKLILFSVLVYAIFLAVIPIMTLFYGDARYYTIAEHDGGYGMLLFMIVIFVLLGHLIRITGTQKNDELSYMFNLSSGALFIQMGALQWSLLTRSAVFFSMYWCILFPKLICCLPQRKRWQYYLLVAILFGFMFFYGWTDVEMYVMHQF